MRSWNRFAVRLASLAVVAVAAIQARTASSSEGDSVASSPSMGDLRREITGALTAAFPKTAAGLRTQAEQFLKLYAAADKLAPADRARFQVRLRSRLSRLADAIRRAGQQARSSSGGTASTTNTASSSDQQREPAGLPGGGPQDNGQDLVDLIEATIAPQSWDVNGGPGTIRYWPAWHVLVVRQTEEVHEQIGGVVHGLRK